MKTLELLAAAYQTANEMLQLHLKSEIGVAIRCQQNQERIGVFLDLTEWPSNPILQAMSDQEKAELAVWGDAFSTRVHAFHEARERLEEARHSALTRGLYSLGHIAGSRLLNSVGEFDKRVAGVLLWADTVRAELLDGLRYVSVREDSDSFARGFYQKTGLTREELFSDLTLCARFRAGEIDMPHEVQFRLGFVREVA